MFQFSNIAPKQSTVWVNLTILAHRGLKGFEKYILKDSKGTLITSRHNPLPGMQSTQIYGLMHAKQARHLTAR